jgi:hypothetical protein
VSEKLPSLGDAAAQMERTAQVPVSIPNDYASPGHKDPNESSRKARLARVAKELDDESSVEGAKRALDRMDGKPPAAEEEPEKPGGGWSRATGNAQTPEQIEEAEEQAAIADAAAEARGEEPEAETPAAEEPAKDDKLAAQEKDRKARFDKTLRLQAKAREAAERVRRAEDALLEREDVIMAREKAIEERTTGAERRAQLAERVLQLATDNPLELLERAGVPPERVARWLQEAGDPTKQESLALRKEFGDLKATLDRERASAKAEREKSEATAKRQQVENQFLTEFDRDKTAFEPARLLYSKKERVELGNSIAQRAAARGIKFTLTDIAEAVNEMAQQDERWGDVKKLRQAAAAKAGASGATTAAVKPVAKAPALAVTNGATQQRSEPRPIKDGATLNQKRRARLDRMYAELDAGIKR